MTRNVMQQKLYTGGSLIHHNSRVLTIRNLGDHQVYVKVTLF